MARRSSSARSLELGTAVRNGTVLWEVRFKEGLKVVAKQKRGGLGKIADVTADWVFNGGLPEGATRVEDRKPKKEEHDGGDGAEQGADAGPVADSVPRRPA